MGRIVPVIEDKYMIAILDYDMGNVGSIQNILYRVGEKEVFITREKKVIERADKLILPGVGAFDTGVKNLEQYHLIDLIKEEVQEKNKPILGICLGMQLLGRKSEEGKEKGLNLIPFDNIRFQLDSSYKIPHMGWDYVAIRDSVCPLVRNMQGEQRYYFVHSYHAVCDVQENIFMTCNYGYQFVAAVCKDNVFGVQFHPEKSHQFGMRLLKNFVEA